jgi:lysophospholipase L1-like esterase
MRRVFRPSPGIMPGVEGESRYITNSEGIRGQELTPDFTYRILSVGGSTTECLYLDQDEAWPQLLQSGLNEGRRAHKVRVGNVGRSGLNSRDHIVQLRHLLEQYRNIDAVVLFVGVNDMASRLRQDANYDPDFMRRADAERRLLPGNFSIFTDESVSFYKKTALWRLLQGARASAFQ